MTMDVTTLPLPTGCPMTGAAAVSHDGGAAGTAVSEYASYMRTDELLALQRHDDEVLHRDERLFQCVHQSTELWLKQACFEMTHAVQLVDACRLSAAAQILGRASACVDTITRQLDILASMASFDFGVLRPSLGQGSGLESPGWRGLRALAPRLLAALSAQREAQRMTPSDLFKAGPDSPLYVLAEALLDLDSKVSVWRLQHLAIAVRTIGDGGIGTKGMPVQTLAQLLSHRLFTDLWEARSATAAAAGN
jgi:tryptophan 2,3-dioxygenase